MALCFSFLFICTITIFVHAQPKKRRSEFKVRSPLLHQTGCGRWHLSHLAIDLSLNSLCKPAWFRKNKINLKNHTLLAEFNAILRIRHEKQKAGLPISKATRLSIKTRGFPSLPSTGLAFSQFLILLPELYVKRLCLVNGTA